MFAYFALGAQEIIILAIVGFLLFVPLIVLAIALSQKKNKSDD